MPDKDNEYMVSLRDIAVAVLSEVGAQAWQTKEMAAQVAQAVQKLNEIFGTNLLPMQLGGIDGNAGAKTYQQYAYVAAAPANAASRPVAEQAIFTGSPTTAIAEIKKTTGTGDCKCCCATEIEQVITAIQNIAKTGYSILTQKEDSHCCCADEINRLLIPMTTLATNGAELMKDIKGLLPGSTGPGIPGKAEAPDISKAIEDLTKAISKLAGSQDGLVRTGMATATGQGYAGLPATADDTTILEDEAPTTKESNALGEAVKNKIIDRTGDILKKSFNGETLTGLDKAIPIAGTFLELNELGKMTGFWKKTKEGYQADIWDAIGITTFAHSAEASVTDRTGTQFKDLDKNTQSNLWGAVLAEGIAPPNSRPEEFWAIHKKFLDLSPTSVKFPDGKGGYVSSMRETYPWQRETTAVTNFRPYFQDLAYEDYQNSVIKNHKQEIANQVRFSKDGTGGIDGNYYDLFHWGTKDLYTAKEQKEIVKNHNMIYDHMPGFGKSAHWNEVPAFAHQKMLKQQRGGGGNTTINIYGGLVGKMTIYMTNVKESTEEIKNAVGKALLQLTTDASTGH